MRALFIVLLALLTVAAVSAEEANPVRAIRARVKEIITAREEFFDNDPLGQKIAQFYLKWKELVSEIRQRVRAKIAKYIKKLKEENPDA